MDGSGPNFSAPLIPFSALLSPRLCSVGRTRALAETGAIKIAIGQLKLGSLD